MLVKPFMISYLPSVMIIIHRKMAIRFLLPSFYFLNHFRPLELLL